MKKIYIGIGILVVLGVVISFVGGDKERVTVSSFEECVKAGNPVMESYPRQCRHNDELFVEEIVIVSFEECVAQGGFVTEDKLPKTCTYNDETFTEGVDPNTVFPSEVLDTLKAYIASTYGISEMDIQLLRATPKEWPNGCLGLAEKGELCAQIITQGYELVFDMNGVRKTFRTNQGGSVVREEK